MIDIKKGVHPGHKVGSEAKTAHELETDPTNYYRCDVCGQQVYMGDLGQVFYHEKQPDHKPMPLDG